MIGNLPYYITSQILFTLADHSASVRSAVVTMQWEVAQRLVAKPRTKDYGILSVVFQLYAAPRVAFKIPPSAFYPAPKVRARACVRARARVCVCVCVCPPLSLSLFDALARARARARNSPTL